MTAAATLPHRDRLTAFVRPAAALDVDVERAVERLASVVAGAGGDELEALEAVARAATRLARAHRHEVPLEEERAVGMMGAWSHDNEMLPHIVLGEN